jgi:uncharacterized membrane protein (UPF0127 family)
VEVYNETQKIALSRDAKIANTFLSRMRGLMLSAKRDLILDSGFDDIPAASIHMLFMKYPIDVAWVNDAMIVVEVGRSLQPFHPFKLGTWRIYSPRKPARYVIELGVGELGTTRETDRIQFR